MCHLRMGSSECAKILFGLYWQIEPYFVSLCVSFLIVFGCFAVIGSCVVYHAVFYSFFCLYEKEFVILHRF